MACFLVQGSSAMRRAACSTVTPSSPKLGRSFWTVARTFIGGQRKLLHGQTVGLHGATVGFDGQTDFLDRWRDLLDAQREKIDGRRVILDGPTVFFSPETGRFYGNCQFQPDLGFRRRWRVLFRAAWETGLQVVVDRVRAGDAALGRLAHVLVKGQVADIVVGVRQHDGVF